MTDYQLIALFYLLSIAMRVPRILERWKSPMLRGPEWFFSVAVSTDFLSGPGAAILRYYRWRLAIPWAIELLILAALLLTKHAVAVLYVIPAMAILTRLNFYAARKAAEDRARHFALPGAEAPIGTVALSLRPRRLGQYTNRWIETVIVLALGGSLAWVGYRYTGLHDWTRLRAPLTATILGIYLQAGLLLVKRAVVRARTVAPAEDAEQYLAWRDSLRRLSTSICDYLRVFCAFSPLIVDLQAVTHPWSGSLAQTVVAVTWVGAAMFAAVYEWRCRLRHLEVARRTRPAKFLVLPDTPDAGWLVCFRPSLPMLLLSGPKGYALNLASTPARVAGLYVAGYAALLTYLPR